MASIRPFVIGTPILAMLLLAPATARSTYSVVATDRASGQVGGAVTSCVGSQGVGVVYRPSVGHGGVNAQAAANANGRDRAVTLLNTDVAPADIITMITATSFDSSAATRQYGVVDLMGRAAGFTGSGAMSYKEDRQGTIGALTYSVQGNILTSRAVIDQAETAFRNTGCDLADKLMLALEAGAMGGEGDSRCTPRGVPSDAASIEVDLNGATAGSYLSGGRGTLATPARSSSCARCSTPGERRTPAVAAWAEPAARAAEAARPERAARVGEAARAAWLPAAGVARPAPAAGAAPAARQASPAAAAGAAPAARPAPAARQARAAGVVRRAPAAAAAAKD